jgi:glycosyltransferase involved in cell wall biosynthesis
MKVMLIPGVEGEIPQSIRVYHHHLARNLQSLNRPGIVVEHFTPKLSGLPRDRRLRSNYLAVANLLIVPWQLRRLRADVVHVLDHSYGAWVRALGPTRTAVTCHDLIPFVRSEMWRTRWGRGFGRRMFALNAGRMMEAARVLAVSRATARDVAHFLGPRGDVSVVPMAVDADTFCPDPSADVQPGREHLGLPADAGILLHVGTCDHYKNVSGALRVLDRVRHRVPRAMLVKVGADFGAEERAAIEALGLEHAVHHLGRLELASLVEAYRAADALLFPSLYEGFGLPVLEAMACGTPVVASCAGALPEVVGDAGLLCGPEDEDGMAERLVRLLENTDERKVWSERGRARVERFNWEQTARLTLECYQSALQGER